MNRKRWPRLWPTVLWVLATTAAASIGLQAGRVLVWGLQHIGALPW